MYRRIDWVLIGLVFLLSVLGFVFIYSASFETSYKYFGDPNVMFMRHLTTYGLGILVAIFFMRIKLQRIFKWYWIWFFSAVVLLMLVYVPGISREVSGAKRWIAIGSFIRMQPSEVAKFCSLIFLAKTLAIKKADGKIGLFFKGTLPTILLMSVILILVLLEPDISTAFLFGLLIFTVHYLVGVPFLHLLFLMSVTFSLLVYFLQFNTYWVNRFIFFDPTIDPFGKGYHLIQSLACFENGGFWGEGAGTFLRNSIRLPDAHTDFIFSVIGKEVGLFGCLLIIILFGLLIYRIFTIANRQSQIECYLLTGGIGMLIAYEMIIHIFVTIGLTPTTGLPLPFISFGRTSLIIHMAWVGLLVNLSATAPIDTKSDVNRFASNQNKSFNYGKSTF